MSPTELIAEAGLTMRVFRGRQSRPGWEEGSRHWRVVIHRDGNRMSLTFSQGSAHTEEPTLEEVLTCLADDCASFENASGLEDYISQFCGEDDEPCRQNSERAYWAIKEQREQLIALLGEELYDKLVWQTDRE